MWKYGVALWMLTGCPGDVEPPPVETDTDTDSDAPDTDSDTEPIETGWLTDTDVVESGAPDTDTDTDADTDAPTDTDTGLEVDTGGCPYGELKDCTGACFPEYFLGDGLCDDGVVTLADLNCVRHRLDEGDCGEIGPGAQACDYVFRVATRGYAEEIGWRLLDAQGVVLYRVPYTSYTEGIRNYDHPIQLSDGTYTLEVRDSWGDGWNNGVWQLISPVSGVILASGGLPDDPAADLFADEQIVQVPLPIDCTGANQLPSCDVTLELASGADGGEMGWELKAASGYVLYNGAGGALGDNDASTEQFTLAEGVYTFRMTDAGRDGWEGGHAELKYAGGYYAQVVNLPIGSAGASTFNVDCAKVIEPPLTSPTAPIDLACGSVRVRAVTEGDGVDVGWTLYNEADWSQVGTREIGTLPANGTLITQTPLPVEGDYMLTMRDAVGDGWQGTILRVEDGSTGAVMFETSLPTGNASAIPFSVICNDDAVDTSPEPPPPCPEGAIQDCDGVCWPEDYLGDGWCDDGVQYAPDFRCLAFNWDDRDCPRLP